MLFCSISCCVIAGTLSDARADLTAKQARKSLTRMAGFELTSGAVRVKSISTTSVNTAEVSAEVRTVFKFEKNRQERWRVAEIRTRPDHWERIDLIAGALRARRVTDECNAPDPPAKGAAATDPSVKRARCLVGRLLGVEVGSDAVRIQEVNPLPIPLAPQPSATVVAWVQIDARLVNEGKTGWQVAELRTGRWEWVKLGGLADALTEEKRQLARADLESIAAALELFRRDRGFYVVTEKQAVVIDHLNPLYLPRVIRLDPWHQPYKYQGERDRFTLSSAGPDRKEATPDDIILSGPSR